MSEIEKHTSAYPADANPPMILAYAFRIFFWVVPFYLTLLAVLWVLVYMGVVSLGINDLVVWHIYELIYGVAAGATGAFLLTAIPEFYQGTMPVVGKRLAVIVAIWVAGRIGFWFMDLLGVWVAMVSNLAFLGAILLIISKPILSDRSNRHLGFYTTVWIFFAAQTAFFLSLLKALDLTPIDLLKCAITIFITIELAALRRIFVGVGNMALDQLGSSEVFFTRPYRYNLAIFSVLLFAMAELIVPNSGVLGWLALAASAFVVALFNDFFTVETNLFRSPIMIFLAAIVMLMAVGFGSIGVAYLAKRLDLIETFRHFLSMGVIGVSLYAVMIVVGFVHTGREIAISKSMIVGFLLLIVAIFLRIYLPIKDQYGVWIFLVSAVLWSLPFLCYIKWFGKILISPRADGLKG